MAAPPPPPLPPACDERFKMLTAMPNNVLPPHPNPQINTIPGNHPNCQLNPRHNCTIRRPPLDPVHFVPGQNSFHTPGPDGLQKWTVCNECELSGREIAYYNRTENGVFARGEQGVFEDGAGAWHMGALCNDCQTYEIGKYYERLYGERTQFGHGGLIQAQQKAANTCKCRVNFLKRYCFEHRKELIHQVEQNANRNAWGPACWLATLEVDPATNRARQVLNNPGLVAAQNARRGPGGPFRRNACRCGRDIPNAPAPGHILYNGANVPTPAAMCTACSGVVVDFNHPRVINHANPPPPPGPRRSRRRTPAPWPEGQDLELGRNVLVV